jgi:hypothetical protein
MARAWPIAPLKVPTAHTLVGELAAKPLKSLLEPGLGLATCSHFRSFQCAMRVWSAPPFDESRPPTRGHSATLLQSNGEQLLCVGDLFYDELQLIHPNWCTPWDHNTVQATRARRAPTTGLPKPSACVPRWKCTNSVSSCTGNGCIASIRTPAQQISMTLSVLGWSRLRLIRGCVCHRGDVMTSPVESALRRAVRRPRCP